MKTVVTKQFNKCNTTSTQSANHPMISSLVSLYNSIGSMRSWKSADAYKLFDKAVAEDKELATKVLFYGRDIREGLGERNTFKLLLRYAARKYPEIVRPNIHLIGYYGRFDDLYVLNGTPCQDAMWKYMKEQFKSDLRDMRAGKPISQLAKWIKTPNASSTKTRSLGVLSSIKLGYSEVKYFKKHLKALRKYLNITEINICNDDFTNIDYNKVPHNAMKRYYELFKDKDENKFNQYLDNIVDTKAITPYNIINSMINKTDTIKNIEKLWNKLPIYNSSNVMVAADLSDSMYNNHNIPISVAISMILYLSKTNTGYFNNKYIVINNKPQIQSITKSTLNDNLLDILNNESEYNTQYDRIFKSLLNTAIKYKVTPQDMPKAILLVTNKSIKETFMDYDNTSLYTDIQKLYENYGYTLPKLVYWSLDKSINVFYTDTTLKNTTIISGYISKTYNKVLDSLTKNPYDIMLDTLNSDRYKDIKIEK